MRLLPEVRDAVFFEPENRPQPERMMDFERLIPWGVSPSVENLARELSALRTPLPPVNLVREINDKRFSHDLEKELRIALPYSQIVTTTAELIETVQDCPFDWVLKHPLGFSARERMVGRRQNLSESAQGWARRKFRQGWTLLFEPWVEERHDYSVHFDITTLGEARYLGSCELVEDPGGVYRGNRVLTPHRIDDRALGDAQRVAQRLADRGYWGPVGIDAFWGRLGEQRLSRPVVEINARYSFGRLALALADWVPRGWSYLWWHPSRVEAKGLDFSHWNPLPLLGQDVPTAGVYGLPSVADPLAKTETVVVMAPTTEELNVLENDLRPTAPPLPSR